MRILPSQFFQCCINKLDRRFLLDDFAGVDRHIAPIAKQRIYRNVSLAQRSRAPALWRHDQDVSHQNILSIPEGRLVMFMEDDSTPRRNVNVVKISL